MHICQDVSSNISFPDMYSQYSCAWKLRVHVYIYIFAFKNSDYRMFPLTCLYICRLLPLEALSYIYRFQSELGRPVAILQPACFVWLDRLNCFAAHGVHVCMRTCMSTLATGWFHA